MAQDSTRKDGRAWDFAGTYRSVVGRFEALVSGKVAGAEQRGAQARVIGLSIASGLVFALISPVAMLCGFGFAVTAGLLALAFAALAAAVALAASGELDLVLAGLHTACAVMLGGLSVALDSLWPMILVIAGPVEALIAGRSVLARLSIPSVLAAFALVGFLSLHGMGPSGQGLAGTSIGLPLAAAYGTFLLCRLHALRGSGGRDLRTEGDEPIFRLDADGNLVGAHAQAAGRFSQRLHLLDRVAFLRAIDGMRRGAGEIAMDLRVQGDAPGTAYRTLSLRLVPQRDAAGDLRGVLAFSDEAHHGFAPASDPAAPSETQNAFLATVSHELRTPLNAIIGFSDLLDGEYFGAFADPRQKEYVGLIRRSSQHLLGVVNGLLDVSKIEAGRYELIPESFLLAEVMRAAAEMVQGEADRKGLRLVIRPCGPDESFVADRRACQQMLVNLLSNAVKFTERGTVCLTSRIGADGLEWSVSDTGIGIEAADIDRLGRPFVQLSQGHSRRYEGTGLGLSLVKGLAELHHGGMRIQSQPGRGTTVSVQMPIDCAERIRAGGTLSENVVALTDARKKNSQTPQSHQDRRSA